MYAVGTYRMGGRWSFDFLDPIPHVFFALALAAWLATALGLARGIRAAPSRGPVDGGFAIRRGVRSRGP